MSRPETLDDVEDRTEQVANFNCDKFLDAPLLLKHYTAFIEAVQKHGGSVENSYGSNVNVFIPKTRKQLQERLQADQASWDNKKELYEKVMRGETIKSYQEYGLKAWAEREGHPEPIFVKEDDDASVS